MFSSVTSGTNYGLKSYLINVEVDLSQGLPCMVMVGSLSGEVKESAERVRIALKNIKITIPAMHIAINLSPADIRKSGTGFDFPIALGLLASMGVIKEKALKDTLVLGEIGLNGEIKPITGVMPIVLEASRNGYKRCLVPKDNAMEAAFIKSIEVIGVENILEALDYLNAKEEERTKIIEPTMYIEQNSEDTYNIDFSDIVGQEGLKRGAVIAAAGFHHVLIMGPPGTGKTMIAKRIPTIMPPLEFDESMDVTAIYSIAGQLKPEEPIIRKRPFMNVHHTVTPSGLVGGGLVPSPGALSLSHKGVMFLDELPEFRRECIDLLRQPLEDRTINISRATGSFVFPADIMLVAAMNPCPCGYYPDRQKCSCSPVTIRNYLGHISGPILDRIDICLTAQKVDIKSLQQNDKDMVNSSKTMGEQVKIARDIQLNRYKNEKYSFNSDLDVKGIEKYCRLDEKTKQEVERMCKKLDISARGYHRLLRVSRTIADLEGCENIGLNHISEAICYRPQLPGV